MPRPVSGSWSFFLVVVVVEGWQAPEGNLGWMTVDVLGSKSGGMVAEI